MYHVVHVNGVSVFFVRHGTPMVCKNLVRSTSHGLLRVAYRMGRCASESVDSSAIRCILMIVRAQQVPSLTSVARFVLLVSV